MLSDRIRNIVIILVAALPILIIILGSIFSFIKRIIHNSEFYKNIEKRLEIRRKYREEKRKQRLKYKEECYNRSLEEYEQELKSKLGKQFKQSDEQQVMPPEDNDFLDFQRFAYGQLKKFSLYSCRNDEDLQSLLDKAFSSVARLTANLDSNNYTYIGISEFYKVILEHFFSALGEETTITLNNKKAYKLLCDCLKVVSSEAIRLEEEIKEWQDFKINVKLDAIIEYINN